MGVLVALLPQLIQFLPVFIVAIQHIKAQTGQTTPEIFESGGIVLEGNDKKLVEDLIRLGVL